MKTSDFDYTLPPELVARRPVERRQDSRLMRIHRETGEFSHHHFRDLPELLRPDDLLVLNDTRVFPARLLGKRAPDGGATEALLIRPEGPDTWRALVRPGKRIKTGARIVFAPGRLEATVEAYGEPSSGERILKFKWEGDWWETLEEIGHTPLPPYILKARKQDAESQSAPAEIPEDRSRYQTLYAGDERGSVAAPTAGLHFSRSVLDALDRRGVERALIQLHVGPGTFQPIKTDRIEDHPMHEEYIRIPPPAARAIGEARLQGRRVVAIGTTVVRALETAALVAKGQGEAIFRPDSDTRDPAPAAETPFPPLSGWTRLMIAPGFQYRVVDALLTNFHLPRSSLLLLVSALAGRETIFGAYREAIGQKYRFYSYGDCMLIE